MVNPKATQAFELVPREILHLSITQVKRVASDHNWDAKHEQWKAQRLLEWSQELGEILAVGFL